MTFVLLYTVMLAMRGFSTEAAPSSSDRSECGIRPPSTMSRRNTRTSSKYQQQQHTNGIGIGSGARSARIIDGSPTHVGQFPWQVSLELLHPTLGFIGHWCGAVLIDRYWVLSAAHCIHNDLFNLPLPPLWTVVLGEFDRHVESGYEQRISVDRIVMHQDYENYQHDLVMIKLAEPADMGATTTVRRICLPFIAFSYPQSIADDHREPPHDIDAIDDSSRWPIPQRDDNFLRAIRLGTNRTARSSSSSTERRKVQPTVGVFVNANATVSTGYRRRVRRSARSHSPERTDRRLLQRRRNDKFLHVNAGDAGADDDADVHRYAFDTERRAATAAHRYGGGGDDEPPQDLPYVDCIATGWGKATIGGDLTDILLQTQVPIHANAKCTAAYGDNVKIHRGHLCAGKLNGKGGTCVGDSGGPLQCRISKNGPWLLAGVTSFGSGCAEHGYPDVYSRISHYVQWITETIESNTESMDGEQRRKRHG